MPRRRNTRSHQSMPAAMPVAMPADLQRVPDLPSWLSNAAFAIAGLICVALVWLSRKSLNPDGVSYLDLAQALARGDWTQFVQGYWSPLYPAIAAAGGWLLRADNPGLVLWTHVVNGAAALGALLILWRWSRAHAQPGGFGLLVAGAFLLCSAGPPRIEAVTPDVLLYAITVALAIELMRRGAERWWLLGLLLGAAYLAKTSCWPWLLVSAPLLLWAERDKRRATYALALAGVIAGGWITAMSLRYERFTMGSSGSLNYSWYIEANTSRLPDTDRGANRAYQPINLPDGSQYTLAVFDEMDRWTYQPWGDPTAWHDKVIEETGRGVHPDEMVLYWMRMLLRVVGLWMLPMLIAVVGAAYALQRRSGIWRELIATRRRSAAVTGMGLLGVLQFVAIHAEPRLIAPFVVMLALGALDWCFAGNAERSWIRGTVLRALTQSLAFITALGFCIPKFIDAVQSAQRLDNATHNLEQMATRAHEIRLSTDHVAIVGAAAPVLSAAYWIGAHVSLQIPPESAERLRQLPQAAENEILQRVFYGRVSLVWVTDENGNIRMMFLRSDTAP